MLQIFIPNHPKQVYGFLIILALFLGQFFIYKQLRKKKAPAKFALFYCLTSTILIYLFSILVNLVVFHSFGLSSAGAGLGLILCALLTEKFYKNKKLLSFLQIPKVEKIPERSFISASVIALPLMYSIAKLACFSAGCCHGVNYKGPFAIHYEWIKNSSFFPIQPLETIVFMGIFLLANKFKNGKNALYDTLGISIFIKLLLDFLRASHGTELISTNQIVCLVALSAISLYENALPAIKDLLSHHNH